MFTAEKTQPSSTRRHRSSEFVRKVTFPLWAKRDHPFYSAYRDKFEQTQFLSTQAIRQYQLTELRKLLEHACRTVPFYRERMQSSGLLCEITSFEDLKRLPVTTKRDIQQAGNTMWS